MDSVGTDLSRPTPDEVRARSAGIAYLWGELPDAPGRVRTVVRVPWRVIGLPPVVDVAGGSDHFIALSPDGTVWGWGNNSVGQVGTDAEIPQDSFGAPAYHESAVRVPGISGAVAVAAGDSASAAILEDGVVVAWGRLPERVNRGVPTNIRCPVTAAAISVGILRIAVLSVEGDVWVLSPAGWRREARKLASVVANNFRCGGLTHHGTAVVWGDDFFTYSFSSMFKEPKIRRPHTVMVPERLRTLVAGSLSFTALSETGDVWSWGWNHAGQLGDGSMVNRRDPVKTSGVRSAARIAARGMHVIALCEDGSLWEWGHYWGGHPPKGEQADLGAIPVAGPHLVGVLAVAASDAQVVAIVGGGEVRKHTEDDH